MREWGPAVLRVAVGGVFVAHGLPKLIPIWGADPASTVAYFASLGLEPAQALSTAVGVVEIAAGFALLIGAFTLWASSALIADMIVAIWKVHAHNGFFMNWALTPGVGHGYEFNLVLIAALVCLILTGAGALSIDGWREQSAEREALGRARVLRNRKA